MACKEQIEEQVDETDYFHLCFFTEEEDETFNQFHQSPHQRYTSMELQ